MSKFSKLSRRKMATIQFIKLFGTQWVIAGQHPRQGGLTYDLVGALETDWAGVKLRDVPYSFINRYRNSQPDETLLGDYLV